MIIHTFGDSHANAGWTYFKNRYMKFHSLGPKLCFSFGRDKLKLLNIRDYNVEENDIVIFCFGEIDLRCNIQKYLTDTNTYKVSIDTIIDNYFKAIEENIKQYNHLNVCVYNVVPTVEKYNTFEFPGHPFMGTDEERKTYVNYFNSKCSEYCLKYKYTFFDIHDKYCDSKGYLNKKYSDDNVHIRNGFFINCFLYTYTKSLLLNDKNSLVVDDLNTILKELNIY